MPKAQFQRLFGTGFHAVAAADALGTVGGLTGVHAHAADLGAFAAVDALTLVQVGAVQGEAVEQAVDVIPILPRFKYRPNDAVDFILWCYINYERNLNGLPEVKYSDVYKFSIIKS